jgi:hypothetical protein
MCSIAWAVAASDPPVVKLPPDGAGYLLERRTRADGREEVLVAWTQITQGPRGGLVPREDWLPLERVQFLPDVDYGAATAASCGP